MANYKLPPRQKMINLLYIILIAMLAINISSDVLDGFHTASRDMEANVKALKGYNGALMKLAAQKGNGSPGRRTVFGSNPTDRPDGGAESGTESGNGQEQPDGKRHGCR